MKKIVLLLFAVLLLVPCLFVSETANASGDNQKRIYNLSESQIKKAINEGKKIKLQDIDNINRLKLVQHKIGIKEWQPKVQVDSPYSTIVLMSASRNMKYKSYSLKEAKKLVADEKKDKEFSISLQTYGDRLDYTKFVSVVIKQNNKIIKPSSSAGLDEFPYDSEYYPESPAYTSLSSFYFNKSKVNFNKKAQVIYSYPTRDYSITYDLDFSKIK